MEDFESLRPQLFAIAYHMLGSVMEAEDIVQDAYLRYRAVDEDRVRSPRAFLKTIVTRLCLDALKSARMKREEYIGPWLPEPIITAQQSAQDDPAQQLNRQETVSIAFMVVMEQLSPLERAVFLLREVFDYDYREIASILQRSEAACRKLFSRAKKQITENRPNFDKAPEAGSAILTSFMKAAQTGQMESLLSLLTEDVVLQSDGGGKVAAARNPLYGRDTVIRFLLGLMKKNRGDFQYEFVEINNTTGMIVRNVQTRQIDSVFTADIVGGRIRAFHVIRNPDKLRHLNSAS